METCFFLQRYFNTCKLLHVLTLFYLVIIKLAKRFVTWEMTYWSSINMTSLIIVFGLNDCRLTHPRALCTHWIPHNKTRSILAILLVSQLFGQQPKMALEEMFYHCAQCESFTADILCFTSTSSTCRATLPTVGTCPVLCVYVSNIHRLVFVSYLWIESVQ